MTMHLTLTSTPEVQDWQWEMAAAMRQGLQRSFATAPHELRCLDELLNAINGQREVRVHRRRRGSLAIEVNSAKLHGSSSMVCFTIGGREHTCELADLLVIATYVEEGKLVFQRACFIQTKRSRRTKRGKSALPSGAARYTIDPVQATLLDGFPKFNGVSGHLSRGSTHELRNRSGMLGAHGLLSPPGNLAVVSSRIINSLLAGRKSFASKELAMPILAEAGAARSSSGPLPLPVAFDPYHCPECREIARYHFPDHWPHHFHHGHEHSCDFAATSDSVLTCAAVDEFVQNWTGMRLGEPWYPATAGRGNLALRRCLQAIVDRIAQDHPAFQHLHSLMLEAPGGATNEQPSAEWADDVPGLVVLSSIATVSREED